MRITWITEPDNNVGVLIAAENAHECGVVREIGLHAENFAAGAVLKELRTLLRVRETESILARVIELLGKSDG